MYILVVKHALRAFSPTVTSIALVTDDFQKAYAAAQEIRTLGFKFLEARHGVAILCLVPDRPHDVKASESAVVFCMNPAGDYPLDEQDGIIWVGCWHDKELERQMLS